MEAHKQFHEWYCREFYRQLENTARILARAELLARLYPRDREIQQLYRLAKEAHQELQRLVNTICKK